MMTDMPVLEALLVLAVSSVLLGACATGGGEAAELQAVASVDLERFMGDWYVIANIPTRFELDAYNAVESYRLAAPGKVKTTFTFRKGSFDGKEKRFTPTGFVRDTSSNAIWGMSFVWPFRADYRIIHLADDYSVTVIGRQKRDYVWIMARTPTIPDEEYRRLLELVAGVGYDPTRVQKVPQRWP
jgi:apolipoprotein D and lipocalin family protein